MRFRALVRRVGVRLLLLGVVSAALVTGAGNAQATSPNAVLTCFIGGPIVTYTFATGEMDWQAGSQCNTTLRMQGSTDLFAWGSPTPRAYGNRYDAVVSSASSTGTAYAIYSGQWGVTINVVFFVPSGWTINPGNICAWVDTAHTQLQCTVTTGPVQTQ